MKLDFQTESAKAAPAVAGALWSAISLNQLVAVATLVYICIQICYLVWKWRNEANAP